MFVQLLSPKRTSKRGILDLKWCPFAASWVCLSGLHVLGI